MGDFTFISRILSCSDCIYSLFFRQVPLVDTVLISACLFLIPPNNLYRNRWDLLECWHAWPFQHYFWPLLLSYSKLFFFRLPSYSPEPGCVSFALYEETAWYAGILIANTQGFFSLPYIFTRKGAESILSYLILRIIH